jgi:L-fuconolactonase
MKIIDTHVHIVDNPDYHGRNLSVEELIEKMDEIGIEKAIIVQSKSGNGLHNAFPAESARTFPGRLIAISGSDALAPDAADVLRFRVTHWGARGIRLFWDGWNQNEARFDPIWAAASELEVPLLFAGPAAEYEQILAVLHRFPKLKIVLDHFSNRDMSGSLPNDLLAIARHPNVVLKFFATYLFDDAEEANVMPHGFFDSLLGAFSSDRMMWGSNYPSSHEPRWPYLRIVEATKELLSRHSSAEQERMFSGTAISLWPELGR